MQLHDGANVGWSSEKRNGYRAALIAEPGPGAHLAADRDPDANGFYRTAPSVVLEDAVPGITYTVSVDGSTPVPYTGPVSLPGGDGPIEVTFQGSDGSAGTVVVLVDGTGPSLTGEATPQSGGGVLVTFTCADGVSGVVRRLAGFAQSSLRAQAVELDTEPVDGDHPRDTIVFDLGIGDLNGYAWDFPTLVDGRPLVCRGAYLIRNLGHDDVRGRLATYLAARGLCIKDYRIKQFAERGWEPEAEISAHRVLLVGEAAGIDIATGEGIGQAIEYGAVAGPYLARALARDDLGFADWRRTVEKHHLGWQLEIRHGCYRAFYGRRRPKIERLMPRLTALFRLGVQDFAGVPLSKLAMVRGAAQFLAAFTRAKLA